MRAGELSHDEPAAIEVADEAAEYGIGHARHGREYCRGGDFYVTNRKACGELAHKPRVS